MLAVVVYESLWGNTAAVARAIAAGLGPQARALSTSEATPAALAGADLIVAGAPVIAFSLPTEAMRASIVANPAQAPSPPDLSNPSLRSWLASLPRGSGRAAAFETRIRFSPGGATKTILEALQAAGYTPIARGQRFIVTGRYGPLRDGELERAHQWGQQLAKVSS